MIDYQEAFKKRVFILFLLILIITPITVIYLGKKSSTLNEKAPGLSVKNSFALHLRGSVQDIKLSKNSKTAYTAAGSRGIYILDVENSMKPKLIGQFKYFSNSYDKARSVELAEERNMLFVKDAQAGIYSIDITNPVEPKLLDTYKSENPIYAFCLSEDLKTIYIADKKGIAVADIQDPDAINVIAYHSIEKRYINLIEVNKNTLYLLCESGIDILYTDGSQPAKLIGSYTTAGDAKKMTLSKDKTKAFVSIGNSGVEILDIANKLYPKPLGIFKTSAAADKTIVSRNAKIIYVADTNGDIEIADIQNPDSGELLQKIRTKLSAQEKLWDIALSVDEKKLFTASGIEGVRVVKLK
ncbi:LVIVD repeat-containing protein [Sulfurimonas paralvinellae]|uniref:Uncharacterized protein n=1 Tax=Sulfurimonas paralvinellae TaxID=317658 RepID=A0A7M1B7G6_9BACT|nr:hypothetical protein [Sulfurimonas paralvinellae]QOP45677.1 hypothetical protein FM071_05005 [Sulfurimonas paralvinellae]